MDLDTYRQKSRQTWDEMSSGWEERREWLLEITGSVNDWIVAQVDPQPGQTILDIAAGTGDLGFAAAERVGDDGRVLTTDFAPEMVEAARRNGESRGLTNVEYQVLDAERMPLEDDSVDGVVSRWSYMLMADPAAALAETRRVLRDGGKLGFAVWQTPDRNMWAAIPAMTLVQRGHMPAPEPAAPGMFAMGERDRVEQLVTGAGFSDPRIEELTFEWHYAGTELWETINRLAGPLAAVIKELSAQEQQETREAIEGALEQYRQGDELVVPAACWGVVAS
jgi:ubiquinone/menaquinone biosynthesis C-methylase UbiE